MVKILSHIFLVVAFVALLGCESPQSTQGPRAAGFSLEKCTQECASFGMEVSVSESKANGHCRCKSVSDGAV